MTSFAEYRFVTAKKLLPWKDHPTFTHQQRRIVILLIVYQLVFLNLNNIWRKGEKSSF